MTDNTVSPRKDHNMLTKTAQSTTNERFNSDLEKFKPGSQIEKRDSLTNNKSANVGNGSLSSGTQLLHLLYEDLNIYRNKLISSLDLVSREWTRHMPVDDTSLKHAHKCAFKAIKEHQLSPTSIDDFLVHLTGDPIRPTGIFNEIRLENIVRSHIYNQDLSNKIYDETFANMFERLSDRKYGAEYWTAQQVKVQNTLTTALKGPTTKMYLNEFQRRAKRDVAIVQAFRSIHERLDQMKLPGDTPRSDENPAHHKKEPSVVSPTESIRILSPSTEQTAASKHAGALQQMKEIITSRTGQLEQVKNKVTSLLLEEMQVNVLMEYVTRLKQSKAKYVQIVSDVQSKLAAIRRTIDCPKSKSSCESEWNELMDRIKTLDAEEQKVMEMLQNNISLATKLMSVINCYKDFYTISKMFEREIESKNDEYNSLRNLLNDKDNHKDKGLLTNIKSKKADICQFVEQCLAKTNKESYLNRMSFGLKRFEECVQSRNEMSSKETISNWFNRKKEEMKTKETQLRQDVEHLQKNLITFDLLIGEAEQAVSTQEHFRKDYIYVCLEGSETYQLKYLCVAYESQKYQIFNDIGEEQMNKKPVFEGKCTSRFLSKMEAKINNQIEKGTGFIFDGHRFFCNDFFEYRCWKSYVLTGHDLRQEQLEWNDQQEKKEPDTQTQDDNDDADADEEDVEKEQKNASGLPTSRTKLPQRHASMSVMT